MVEVILNESYYGVYVLEEKIDRKLLGLKKITPPTNAKGDKLWHQVDFSLPENGSVLYKTFSNKASLSHIASVENDFEQKYPKQKKVVHWKPLKDLVTFIVSANDKDFTNGINSRIDIDSVVDYWILTLMSGNTDTLKKNYYLARNEFDKFFIVPWGYDSTFGIAWHGKKDITSYRAWDTKTNNLIRRLSALPATGFNSKVKARWKTLSNSTLSRGNLIAGFNNYSNQLFPVDTNEENPFKRNLARWPHSGAQGHKPFTETNLKHDHNHQLELGGVTYIDNWIKKRLLFLDVKINAQPEK
ncbi:MAG: CotH kinase family protein [Methylococcales bacterium]|nr:CotH kinase family protein [Methylococcales bacterium]